MQEDDVVRSLAALAHPIRLRVFRALVVAGEQGLTPGVMQEGLAVPATTLSFHLKELVSAGLARTDRAGRHLVYRAEFAAMNSVVAYLGENCCGGKPCGAELVPLACDC